jgi:hypothetical protein
MQLRWEMPVDFASIAQPPAAALTVDLKSPVASSEMEHQVKPTTSSMGKDATPHPNLEDETRTHVDTRCAAYWLNRKEQTLRAWASSEKGPIRPDRIHGRLAWPVAEIRNLLKK